MSLERPESPSLRKFEAHERPVKLYHASPSIDIDVLEPRNKTIRHPDEGPVVFAAPDKASAVSHLFESSDRWTQMGRINGVLFTLIAADRDVFIQQDKGGVVYELPTDSFYSDPTKGRSNEWVSKTAVRPSSKEPYPSALDAMLSNGVQVYFTDEATLKRFQAARDSEEQINILTSIPSENQSRHLNVKTYTEE